MKNLNTNIFFIAIFLIIFCSCKSNVKQQDDKIYSRHLQKHLSLTIISTHIPDDKSELNLLLYTDASTLDAIHAKNIIDSLSSKKLIQPLLVVGINANKNEDYGLSGLSSKVQTGSKAAKFNEFIREELYPFIKKKTAVRKFKSIAICGSDLSAVSALDIAWQNADKIDRLGVFSGDFNYANNQSDSLNTVLNEMQTSRKRPKLLYWIYAADDKNENIYENSQQFISIIQKKNIGSSTDIQFVTNNTEKNNVDAWSHHFPEFLLWAFGR